MARAIDRWELMTTFFEEKGLVRQHLDSYNSFIKEGLQQIVEEVGRIEPDIEGFCVEFGKIRVEEPNVTEADGSVKKVSPSEARIRNLTYSAPIYLEMTPVLQDSETGIEERGETIDIYIGRIPIMLKSERCGLAHLSPENLVKVNEDPRDPGGYFIVNGSERVLVTQEDLAPNRILTEEAGSSSSATHVAKVFSTARGFRAPVTLERTKDNELRVSFPSIPGKIPLIILVRALGLITDKEVIETFSEDFEIRRELIPTLEAAAPIYVPKDREETRRNALDYIGRRVAIGQTIEYRLRRAEQVLDRYLLPHIGMRQEDRIRKAYYLTQMAQRLIELILGKRAKDDKDHYSNKRLKLAGELLTSLFRVAFLNLVRDVKYQLERTAVRGRKPNIRTAVRADVITERLKHALATGNWVGGKAGVSQLLDRTNYISTLSHLRRIVSPLSRSQPHFEARDLHPTHWGRICVAPSTLVTMADKVTQTPISDLEQNYSEKTVATVNLADFRIVPSTLHDYQKFSPIKLNKRVYRITTISGRTIEATADHPFFTLRGWVSGKDLNVNDKVLVFPGIEPIEIEPILESQGEILSEKEFLEGEWITKLTSSERKRLAGYAEELKEKGLLPLKNTNPKLPIVARLFGYIITDGSVGKTVEFYCGCREDVKDIQTDLLELGFKPTSISTKIGTFPVDGEELTYTTERTTKGGSFLSLMLALGCPRGKRVSQPSVFPKWVPNSSLLVQREFLAGYLGGDGSAPRFYRRSEEDRKDSYKIKLDRIAGHKEKEFASTLREFFEKMRNSFRNFNIKTLGIGSKSLDDEKIQVGLQFSQEHSNIVKIAKLIGFRYCKEKQSKAALVQEYLNYKEWEISIRSKYVQEAITLFKNGVTKREIAKHLSLKFNRNITHRAIDGLLLRIDERKKLVMPKSSMNINDFLLETCADFDNGFLYLPIDRIEESRLEDVRDFTTVSKNHNFIANGFLTHNCPNETPEGPNCVVPNTRVTISGGSTYQIGDLEKDGKWRRIRLMSSTWNVPNNHQTDAIYPTVARFIKNKANGRPFKLYNIKTDTGRTISATADHPFYTDQGRLEAKRLTHGTKAAVLPAALQRPDWGSEVGGNDIIISEKGIIEACPPHSKVQLHCNFLKKLGLIPLRRSDPRYRILLRLLAFLYGDGHLSFRIREGRSGKPKSDVSVHFVGQVEDLKDIQTDIAMLGFRSSKIYTSKAESVLPDRIIKGKTSKIVCYQKPFWVLMKGLGAPVGDKQKQDFSVPEWLFNASGAEIREFLAAFFGCEMLKPLVDKRTGKVFVPPSIKMSKEISMIESLREFFMDIKRLAERFDIQFPEKVITPKEKFVRKDGTVTQKLQLNFSGSVENLAKLWGKIGYTYNRERECLAQRAYGYLHRHLMARSKRQEAARYVMGRRRVLDGTPTEKARIIMKELKDLGLLQFVRLHDIVNWIKTRIEPSSARVSEIDSPSFDEWVAQAAMNLEGDAGLIWETVETVNIKITEPSQIVEDVTMADRNHNFFVNGFLTGNCGLVKNLALMAYISVGTDEGVVENVLLNLGVYPAEEVIKDKTKRGAQVFLNGRLVGVHPKAKELVTKLRAIRRKGEIDDEVNAAYDVETNEVQINCDSGRARRPLIIVEDGVPKIKPEQIEQLRNREIVFSDLVAKGIVEYLDSEEEENSFIALDPKDLTPEHTHLEIAPSAILGITASTTPFPEYNQSPRNVYQAGMSKQALGIYATNYRHRVDTRSHLLHYPQRPIVETEAMDAVGFASRPAGQNLIVAVLSFQGYNLEDALVINKASIERGVGRGTFFRSYEAEERKYPGGQEDRFEIPEKSVRGYRIAEAYRHLSEDGIIEPEMEVTGGDVLIGRSSPPRFLEEYSEFEAISPIRRETSINMRHGERGVVDTVILSETMDGSKLIKIKVRDQRIPELGDKFASRHGQKGVIGLIVPQEDMPFTGEGIVPDLIVNPHAIPSRMTVGQIMEGLAGKVGALRGDVEGINGNAFSGEKGEVLFKMLKELGFKPTGREVMYDGMTGRKYIVDVFMAVVYYQKLHHMVADKMHARARGPVQILTRQPTEGRAREGGLRFGEMERDCLIGHGAALVLKERLLDESDKYNMLICENCGTIGVYDRNKDRYYCPICGDKGRVSQVSVSYAFKLLLQELMSLGIFPRVDIKERI